MTVEFDIDVMVAIMMQDDSPDAKETIWRTISRKDAAQFVRGVKRYGLAARIDDICADVGKGMEDLTRPQKLALWNIFIDTCRQCVAKTEAENQDAKVGGDSSLQSLCIPSFHFPSVMASAMTACSKTNQLVALGMAAASCIGKDIMTVQLAGAFSLNCHMANCYLVLHECWLAIHIVIWLALQCMDGM
jgi:hypothetical protein